MDAEDPPFERKQIEKAIAAQQGLRGTLDDAIIDITLAVLRKRLAELSSDPVVEQQRKQVTILFMDVAGSTRLIQKLDPEENMAIMDTSLQTLARPVNEHGGLVTRFMGDGFLAVFGLPKARENDPEMAVRAGLEILETTQKIAQELRQKYQFEDFQVRIGVNTGLVVAGGVTEAEGTVMGSAVNLAARLESAAPPGGMLISQNTYQHVHGIFDLYPGKSIKAKGFRDPVQVYQVKRAKPRSFRLKTRGVEGIETPMIGREGELSALQFSLESVLHDLKSRFITVIGEAGVGKSRLIDEFENWLDSQPTTFLWMKGRATLDTMDLPYALLRDLFDSSFEILEDDPLPVVRKKIVDQFFEVLGEEQAHEMKAHFAGQLLGYDFHDSVYLQGALESPQQLRDRAFVYLTDFIKAHAIGSPVVILLDDVHWADDSSLDLIERMSEMLADHPVLFVALTRPALSERRHAWGMGSRQQQLVLKPLSRLESERMLEKVLLKVSKVPEGLRELIVNHAEGNPFYLEELVKMLVEEGVIVKGEPIWHVNSGRLLELHVPSTLTGVIQARLDRLSNPERVVLQQASVIGKIFWDEAISFINKQKRSEMALVEPESARISLYLNTLQDRDLIFLHHDSAFSDAAEFSFRHAVIHEVTYESVLIHTRRLYHTLVADWLVLHNGDRIGDVTGLIANHLEKAGRNKEALEYLCKAAELAVAKYAVEEAADFYTRALALIPDDDLERRYRLLLGREWVLKAQGNRDGQRAVLESLSEIVDIMRDERKRAELLIRKAWFAFWISKIPDALASARESVTLSEKIGDQILLKEARYAWAWLLNLHGELDLAQVQAEKALSMARLAGDPRTEGNANNILGLINIARGNFFAARHYMEEFLARSQEIGDLERVITAHNNLGVALTRLGDYPTAFDHFYHNLSFARENGDRSQESTSLINLGWVTASQGKWELALKYVETGIAKKREYEHTEALAEGLLWLGHAWVGLNQPKKAIAAYQESLEVRQKLHQVEFAMECRAGLARAALAQADFPVAFKRVKEILSFLTDGGSIQSTWEPLRTYLTCYRVLKQAGGAEAIGILQTAFNLLQEQAARISDQGDRRLFLENVSWHREIKQAWEASKAGNRHSR